MSLGLREARRLRAFAAKSPLYHAPPASADRSEGVPRVLCCFDLNVLKWNLGPGAEGQFASKEWLVWTT